MSASLQTMTVHSTELLTDHTLLLLLTPSESFTYQGGQYIQLGMDAESERKPFSIASASRTDGNIELHIRQHEDNDWMNKLFALTAGETVWVEGPNEQYAVKKNVINNPDNTLLVFIAGGTGFAPMKALLDEYLALNTQNPIQFYWGARTAKELYLHDTMQTLAAKNANLNYVPVLSEDDSGSYKTGLVHQQVLADHTQLDNCCVTLCGPWPMQEAAKADFMAAGLAEQCFN